MLSINYSFVKDKMKHDQDLNVYFLFLLFTYLHAHDLLIDSYLILLFMTHIRMTDTDILCLRILYLQYYNCRPSLLLYYLHI